MKRLPTSLSPENFRIVWHDSRDSSPSKPGAAGVDGVRAPTFASRLADHVGGIREDIRSGIYRFSKLRVAPVEKKSGGYRIIAIPTVRDRLLQRALLRHLDDAPRFSASSAISFGFARGKSLSDAQRHALSLRQQYTWVLKVDIVKFFDHIPRVDIKNLIRKNVGSKVICDLLWAAVDCELDDDEGSGAEIARANGIKKGLGLRQGMPVSPMLSNLLLKKFDESIIKRRMFAIRYADDIAVFCRDKNECLDAFKLIRDLLLPYGLSIADLTADKTSISGPSDAVEFLGVEIRRFDDHYKLCAPTKKLAKINSDMASIASILLCVEKRRNIGQLVRTLDSFVIGHNASMQVLDSPEVFLSRLEAMKQMHLTQFLTSLIGPEVVQKLDEDKLAILGIRPFK